MKTLYKWSVEDYHQIIESGVLEGKSVELLEGEIITMSPEKPIHSSRIDTVADYLRIVLQGKAKVREAHPITLDNSEPEPDIAIVRFDDNNYASHHPYPQNIYWLVEVSNSTLVKAEQCGLGGFPHEQLFQEDLEEKPVTYARNGIIEYWVVDLPHNKLWVFTQPKQNGYANKKKVVAGNIYPISFPNLNIEIGRLLSNK